MQTINGPSRSVGFQYDTVGRVAEVRDASSVNAYQYDALDRIVQSDTTTAAGSHRLTYQFDSLGRLTQKTLSGTGINTPQTTTFTWDIASRLLGHTTTVAGVAHATTYSYDAANRVATRRVQAGCKQVRKQTSLPSAMVTMC